MSIDYAIGVCILMSENQGLVAAMHMCTREPSMFLSV